MTPLSSVSHGAFRCHSIEGEGVEVVRLKRLGICAGHRIEVVRAGDPMILEVIGTQIGLSRRLASRVLVESVEERAAANGGAA